MSLKTTHLLDPATAAKIAKLARKNSGKESTQKATDEEKAMSEGDYETLERQRAETESLKQRNHDRKANRELRKQYATQVMRYLCVYSVFVGCILILAGFKVCQFELPTTVLDFLVGSTAAAAIGLVFAVTNGLFKGLDN